MKNFITKTAAVAALSGVLLSSSAFAGQEGAFYLKLDGGATMLNNLKDKEATIAPKFKGSTPPSLSVGAGYYLMDNVRADLSFGMLFNPKHKAKYTDEHNTVNTLIKGDVKYSVLSAYVDLFDISVVKAFAGAGAGVSRVKINASQKAMSSISGITESENGKTKPVYNFTYHLTAGASAEVTQGVNLELAYSWKDFGKPGKDASEGFCYRGHNLSAGVRFDL